MQVRRMSRSSQFVILAFAVTLAAFLISCVDIHSTSFEATQTWIYIVLCTALGLARPKLLWLWPFVFAFMLYAVHVWAIRHGFKQPFVERDEDHAIGCLSYAFPPCLLSGMLGGGIRVCCNFLDR